MSTDALKETALRVAVLVDALESRSESALRSMEASAGALIHTASSFGQQGQTLVRDVSEGIQAHTRQSIMPVLQHASEPFREQLQSAASAALAASRQLEVQTARLAGQQRSMLWVSGTALALGAALSVAGSSLFVWAKWRELQQLEFADQIHAATESGALAPCGDALCVRVPQSPTRLGPKGEYIVVE